MASAEDRRLSPRTATVFDAVIATEHPLMTMDCSISNISVGGACMWTPSQDVPSQFYLIDVIAQVAYCAEVVWRRAPHVGVRFTGMVLVSERTAPTFLTAALAQRRVQDTEALMKKQREPYPVGRPFHLDPAKLRH